MKVSQSSLLDLMGHPDARFSIPAYQRRYSWQERQCEELWLDVLRAGRRDEGHFSGTILYEPDGSGAMSIVDGQQRMTTVTLMLAALRNHLRSHPEHARGGLDAATIDSTYLTVVNAEDADEAAGADVIGQLRPKLALSRLDEASMAKAVAGASPDGIPSHNISHNLAYFQSLMDQDGFDSALFWRGLQNLNVVMAQMGPEDDAQAVFESLNSKGLKLNIGDMVRNYLLASESHDEQARLYVEYWTVIEGVFDPDPGSLKLDTMIKAWLSVRFTKVRARTPEDVYSAFKRYYDDEYAGDLEPVLNELRSFAMIWAENYRYHAVKKFRSMPWATNGAQTLTSGYELKKADNEEYAERVRQELRAMGREL